MRKLAYLFVALAAGCGNGTPTPMPDMKPAQTAPALYVGANPDAGMPADESCLGSRMDPAAPTMDTMLAGTIKDFQDSNPVAGAVVSVYTDPSQMVNNMPVAQSAPSGMDGSYTITVPKGYYRVIFGNSGGMAISNGAMTGTIPAFEYQVAYNVKDRVAVKTSTRDVIPSLVGITPDPTLGVLAGVVRDCGGKIAGGATVQVTTTPPYDQTLIFYFVNAGGTPVPSRNAHWTSGDPGVYAALNVPTGTATVTATGSVAAGMPQTLGSASIPVLAGSIVIADILPTPGK